MLNGMGDGPAPTGEKKHHIEQVDYGGMAGHDPFALTAQNYRRFAVQEAAGRSPAYEALANAVADDPEVLSFLEALPPDKRQPNLFFAAARYLLGIPPDHGSLRHLVQAQGSELSVLMHQRRTQTNEPARCTLLLPVLAGLPQPLALIEVGASAGLTLLPDHYNYDYAGHVVTGLSARAPVLACQPSGAVPLPQAVPSVSWRKGLDINPLDVNDEDDVAWLGCMLWPGEQGRSERLASAIELARQVRPQVETGDLLDDLGRVAQGVPRGVTLVVYHSAVLAYVGAEKRRAFAAAVGELGAIWLSLEGPSVLSGIGQPEGLRPGFLVVRDGREVLATADPHGTWLHWAPEATD